MPSPEAANQAPSKRRLRRRSRCLYRDRVLHIDAIAGLDNFHRHGAPEAAAHTVGDVVADEETLIGPGQRQGVGRKRRRSTQRDRGD